MVLPNGDWRVNRGSVFGVMCDGVDQVEVDLGYTNDFDFAFVLFGILDFGDLACQRFIRPGEEVGRRSRHGQQCCRKDQRTLNGTDRHNRKSLDPSRRSSSHDGESAKTSDSGIGLIGVARLGGFSGRSMKLFQLVVIVPVARESGGFVSLIPRVKQRQHFARRRGMIADQII